MVRGGERSHDALTAALPPGASKNTPGAACKSAVLVLLWGNPTYLNLLPPQNLDPGIKQYLDSLFTPDQMIEEHAIWTSHLEQQRGAFYEGMCDFLLTFTVLRLFCACFAPDLRLIWVCLGAGLTCWRSFGEGEGRSPWSHTARGRISSGTTPRTPMQTESAQISCTCSGEHVPTI